LNNFYDDNKLNKLYDEKYFSTRSRPRLWDRRSEFIIEKFHPKTVLDVGCAFGELVESLVNQKVDAYGVDGSEHAVSKCSMSIKNRIFKVNLNCDKFPFEDKKFDFVGSFYSVEHIHNIDFFVIELARILKDDGIAWFLTPNEGKEGRGTHDVFTNKFKDWKKLFENHNFVVTKFNPHEMLALKGRLGKFHFYKLPKPIQRFVKLMAYNFANRKMNDTSFILTKK
jgi:SAM-dependent methyltransferase